VKEYPQGTPVKVESEFYDVNGDLADPTNPTVVIKVPDGTETAHVYPGDTNVVRDSTGKYHFWVQTAAFYGEVGYRWVGTGATDPRDEDFFTVVPKKFTHA
jgi:hypothetical protein